MKKEGEGKKANEKWGQGREKRNKNTDHNTRNAHLGNNQWKYVLFILWTF